MDENLNLNIINVEDVLDLYTAVKLKDEFRKQINEGHTRFIVNLANTRYVDSSGLGVLIHMHATAKENKLYLRLIYIAPTILQVIKLTHLEQIFKILPDLESAIDELKSLEPELAVSLSHVSPVPPEPRPALETKEIAVVKQDYKKLIIDDSHYLFNKEGLKFKEFHIGLKDVGKTSAFLAFNTCPENEDINLLESQIYELINNAVKHGNKKKSSLPVKVWYSQHKGWIKLIVQDEGKGFGKIEEWNEFYKKRMECIYKKNYRELEKYLTFRTPKSDNQDRGMALFAAIEYWNQGMVYNKIGNILAVKRGKPDNL